jgi:hypothetical protein
MKSNRFAFGAKSNIFVPGVLFVTLVCFFACTKNTPPQPPIHDTVTIHHTDTLRIPVVPDTPNMKNGLVLYLPFNGSFADSSGGGNTVTAIAGATLDYDMHGYAQSAFNATGNGERLLVSNNGFYKVDTAFSVSCDFMIRSNAFYSGGYDFSGLMVFLSIVNTSTGNGPTFNIGMTLPTLPQYFTFNINGAQGADCSGPGTNNPSTISDTTHFTPQLGSWYNAVCTFTKGTASVYINGKLVSSVKNSNTLSALFCPDAKFVVGGWWDGGNSGTENIRGKLDEVRLYNRTLNAKEIAWLARNFQPGSTRVTPSVKTN